MKWLLWFMPAAMWLVSGCSSGAGGTGPIGTVNLLKPVYFTGNVLVTSNRLMSYSSRGGRLSLLDPDLGVEIWGKDLPGYTFAMAHPDLNGATLFNDTEARVVVNGGAEQRLPLLQAYAHVSAARDQVAYVFAAVDGGSFEVLRTLGAGNWQQQVFTVPWAPINPAITAPATDQPVLLVTAVSRDGTMVIVLRPADGAYAVYTAPGPAQPLNATAVQQCSGALGGSEDAPDVLSMAWDQDGGQIYLGSVQGVLYRYAVLDPGCVPETLALSSSIDQLDVLGANVVGAGQILSGSSSQYDRIAFSTTMALQQSVTVACGRPLSAMALGGELVLMCMDTTGTVNASPDRLSIDPRMYILLDAAGTELARTTIDAGLSAGVAIDPVQKLLYRMEEGVFGNLETINLSSGERVQHQGIFIRDLLNR